MHGCNIALRSTHVLRATPLSQESWLNSNSNTHLRWATWGSCRHFYSNDQLHPTFIQNQLCVNDKLVRFPNLYRVSCVLMTIVCCGANTAPRLQPSHDSAQNAIVQYCTQYCNTDKYESAHNVMTGVGLACNISVLHRWPMCKVQSFVQSCAVVQC